MNKRIKGRSLGREKDQKQALMRTLLVGLIESKRITTTLAKAKELRPFAEKMLTLAKKGLENDAQKISKIRLLKKDLPKKFINELFEIAKISKREGGYTRIIKLMPRKSDASPMALIEWVDQLKTEKKKEEKGKSKKDIKKTAVKKESSSDKITATKKK